MGVKGGGSHCVRHPIQFDVLFKDKMTRDLFGGARGRVFLKPQFSLTFHGTEVCCVASFVLRGLYGTEPPFHPIGVRPRSHGVTDGAALRVPQTRLTRAQCDEGRSQGGRRP